ncbi:MAG: ABC transporter permease [Candidatus Acidiferrales bacterium]|jgi:predicted permease
MPTLSRMKYFFRNILASHRNDRDLDDEVRSYADLLAQEKIHQGMADDEARRTARLELGGIEQVKEQVREVRVGAWFDSLLQDLRYGARMLRKNPGFTAVAVLTLALGIGANTAIFSVVNAVLLRPLPYANPQQLIVLRETTQSVGPHSPSYPDFLDWRKQSRTFGQMAAINNREFNLSGIAQPENISGYAVSANCLSMLDVRPLLGRDFLPSEDAPGTAPVVLLSYALWQSHLGADPNAVGKSITLDGRSFTIIGVLPPNIRLPEKTDVLAPIGVWAGDTDMTDRGDRGDMDAVGRLVSGASISQAQAEMDTIAANLRKEYPATNSGVGISMASLRDQLVGDSRSPILVLFGAVVFVLLIACVNVANLFLVRGAARAREIAVRQACGASRERLIRQMLTESFLLAFLGGGLGILVGALGIEGLRRLHFHPNHIGMDRSVLLFSAAIIVLVAIASGLVPAWQVSQPRVQETLKDGGRSSTAGAAQHRLRGVLVMAETALALVLLVGAGLMMKSMYRLLQVDPGFRPERVLTMEINLRTAQYSKPEASLNFWREVLDKVRALPGVDTAALGTVLPLSGNHDRGDITIEGLPTPELGKFPHPDYHTVSPSYIDALSIPLLRGRNFTDADTDTAPRVALINATMARRFWPNEDATGKRFHWGHPGSKEPWIEIIGVVGDTKLYGLANPSRLELYMPLQQSRSSDMFLVLRSAIDPASLTPAVRDAVAAIDKDQPVFNVNTMKQLVDDSVATRHITLVLLGLFSGLALLLAAIGIYGVISYSVQQRTHEIGIRMALGAQRRDVLRLVVGQGVRLAALGIAIGIAAAFGLTRLMASLLFGVGAYDPVAFMAAALLLLLVAIAACYIPARRAIAVDPMVALRYE